MLFQLFYFGVVLERDQKIITKPCFGALYAVTICAKTRTKVAITLRHLITALNFVGFMSKSKKKNSTKPKGFSDKPRKKSILDKIAYILLTLSGIILVKGFVRAEIDQLFYVACVTVVLLCAGLIIININKDDD